MGVYAGCGEELEFNTLFKIFHLGSGVSDPLRHHQVPTEGVLPLSDTFSAHMACVKHSQFYSSSYGGFID